MFEVVKMNNDPPSTDLEAPPPRGHPPPTQGVPRERAAFLGGDECRGWGPVQASRF